MAMLFGVSELAIAHLLAQASSQTHPSKAQSWLEAVQQHPVSGGAIALFVIVSLGTAAIAAWTGNLGKIIDFIRKYLTPTPAEPKPEDLKRLRKQLLEILTSRVAKRRADSLHNLIQIDLEREEQRQRIGRPNLPLVPEDSQPRRPLRDLIGRGLQIFNRPTESEPVSPTQKTLDLFRREDVNGRLLILGEPGSGKTTELLGLADDLLQAASEDEVLPIPVIFELSAWDGTPLTEWLVEQLYEVETVPRAVGKRWVEGAQLLLLLDGLDELGLKRQRDCIEAIDDFLKSSPAMQAVVCCRREEYEVGERKFEKLNGAIYLQVITDEKIQSYLTNLGRSSLWVNIQADPELQELARLPLFLTMLIVAYEGQAIRSPQELFERYIHRQLNSLQNQGSYPPRKASDPDDTKHYLSWLAKKLDERNKTDFFIENLQPNWLNNPRERKKYRLIYLLIYWLILGLTGEIMLQMISRLISDISFGLFAGSIIGTKGWDCGIIFGLIGGMIFGLLSGLTGEKKNINSYEKFRWSWKNLLSRDLIFALIGGLIFVLIESLSGGLIFGLIFGLTGGLTGEEKSLDLKDYPNQGVRKSGKNGLIGGLIFGLIFGLAFGLFLDLGEGLIFGLGGALIFGLIFGLRIIMQHSILRVVLYKSGSSPWNYARFLDHAANLRFIQRVGGRYRFMHDLLRKHFAEMDTQPPRR